MSDSSKVANKTSLGLVSGKALALLLFSPVEYCEGKMFWESGPNKNLTGEARLRDVQFHDHTKKDFTWMPKVSVQAFESGDPSRYKQFTLGYEVSPGGAMGEELTRGFLSFPFDVARGNPWKLLYEVPRFCGGMRWDDWSKSKLQQEFSSSECLKNFGRLMGIQKNPINPSGITPLSGLLTRYYIMTLRKTQAQMRGYLNDVHEQMPELSAIFKRTNREACLQRPHVLIKRHGARMFGKEFCVPCGE